MALLQADKDTIFGALMRYLSARAEACGFLKADLSAAIDATDTWIESNQASYNSALPLAFRTNATLTQKTLLFMYVAMKRAGLSVPREG